MEEHMKYRLLAVLYLSLLVGCGSDTTQVNSTQPPVVNPPIVNPPNPEPNPQPALSLSVTVAQRGEAVEILNAKFAPGITVKVANENAEVIGNPGSSLKFIVPTTTLPGLRSVVIDINEQIYTKQLNVFVDSTPVPVPPTAQPDLVMVTIQSGVTSANASAAMLAAGFELVDVIVPANGISGANPCDRLTYGLKDILGRSQVEIMQALQRLKEIIFQINPVSRTGIKANLTSQQILTVPTTSAAAAIGTLKANASGLGTLANDPTTISQYAYAVGAPAAWSRGLTGAGVTIAILDTGVLGHISLQGRLDQSGLPFTGDDIQDSVSDHLDGTGEGHGTGAATLAAGRQDTPKNPFLPGVATGATIKSVRVCDRYGRCRASDVIRGLCYTLATTNPKKLVINMSLGGDNQSETLDDVVRYAISQGALVVAAAGNDGLKPEPLPHFPAASSAIAKNDGLISVAALQFSPSSWRHADFSTSGKYIDIAAPGNQLAGCAICPGVGFGDGYSAREGTSFAAPLVAGALAIWREAYPDMSPADIEAGLKASAAPVGGGTPETVGAGMINLADQPSLTLPVEPDKYQKVTLNFSELVGKIQIYKLDASGARSEIAYLYDNGAFDLTPYLDAGGESSFVVGNVVDPGGIFSRPRRYLRTVVTADDQTIGGVAYGCGSCSSGDVYTFTINKKLGTIR
jgi:subtilisin